MTGKLSKYPTRKTEAFPATITERQEEDKIFNHVGAEEPELKEGVETKYSDGHYDTRDHTKELEEARIHLSGSLQVFLPTFFLF